MSNNSNSNLPSLTPRQKKALMYQEVIRANNNLAEGIRVRAAARLSLAKAKEISAEAREILAEAQRKDD
eukprot:scaffold20878_cov153-Amphora_coffeaeformis.AAC.2